MTPSEIWANAGEAASPTTRTKAITRAMVMRALLVSSRGWMRGSLYPEVLVQLVHAGGQVGVRYEIHHPDVLHDVVPIGHGGPDAEVLLDEQDGEALGLEARDRAPDLLHDDRGQALGRLVEQQEPGAG